MNSTTNAPANNTTTAFAVQAAIAFSIALGTVVIGEIYLPVTPWVRAFLALGSVFLVSSSFTLAKCVRDRQESESVVGRIDAARVERLLAMYDPYKVDHVEQPEYAAPANGATPPFTPAH